MSSDPSEREGHPGQPGKPGRRGGQPGGPGGAGGAGGAGDPEGKGGAGGSGGPGGSGERVRWPGSHFPTPFERIWLALGAFCAIGTFFYWLGGGHLG